MSWSALLMWGVPVFIAIAIIDGVLRAREVARRETHTIDGDGEFDEEVVGESHYQSALRSLVKGSGRIRERHTAHLVCDNHNRHDDNAVRVLINGKHVGHLSRESAARHRRFLRKKGLGDATCIAQAVIVGGGKGSPSYGVWLNI